MKIPNKFKTVAVCAAAVLTTLLASVSNSQAITDQDIVKDLVAYWPMDITNSFGQTPDICGGYNLTPYFGLNNAAFYATNFSPDTVMLTNGYKGMCAYFGFNTNPLTGSQPWTSNSFNTCLGFVSGYGWDDLTHCVTNIYLTNSPPPTHWVTNITCIPMDKIPITRYAAAKGYVSPGSNNWTISMWVKASDQHPGGNNDQRIWCEGNTSDNNPGLDIAAYYNNWDFFVRQTATGPPQNYAFGAGGHVQGSGSPNMLFTSPDAWHNLTVIATNRVTDPMSNGIQLTIYIDGVADSVQPGAVSPGRWKMNDVAFDVWMRSTAPGNAWFTNLMVDDVAVWSRALGAADVIVSNYLADCTNVFTWWTNTVVYSNASLYYTCTNRGCSTNCPRPDGYTNLYVTSFTNGLPVVTNYVTNLVIGYCFCGTNYFGSPITNVNELAYYITNGINTNLLSPPPPPPLAITKFTGDLGLVGATPTNCPCPIPGRGLTVTLSWQCNVDATFVGIDQGVGEVTTITKTGGGNASISVTPTATTTYTLTVRRGSETVTAQYTVYVVAYVPCCSNNTNSGWLIIDDFDSCEPAGYDTNNALVGALLDQENWKSILHGIENPQHGLAHVLSTVSGNQVLGLDGSGNSSGVASVSFLPSPRWARLNGDCRTLFFRFFLDPSIQTQDVPDVWPTAPDVDINVGITDAKAFRDSKNYSEIDVGPAVRIIRATLGAGGPIDLTANWGPDVSSNYTYVADAVNGNPAGLSTGVVYSVWICFCVETNAADPRISSYYTVQLQKGTNNPVVLFTHAPSDRSNSVASLQQVFIASSYNGANPQGTNVVLFDDFWLTQTNCCTSYPWPSMQYTPVANFTRPYALSNALPALPVSILITNVTKKPAYLSLTWNTTPAGTYTYRVERRTLMDSTSNGWLLLTSSITNNSFFDSNAPASSAYYRVRSP